MKRLFLLLPLWLLLATSPAALAADRFTDNNDGTVIDHQLGLMWAATDNMGDITWRQARKWIQYTLPYTLPVLYKNWRLPTLDELKSLYTKNSQPYESDCGQQLNTPPAIHLSCGFVWSADRESITAWVFNFGRGTFHTDRLVHKRGHRALAVRTIQDATR